MAAHADRRLAVIMAVLVVPFFAEAGGMDRFGISFAVVPAAGFAPPSTAAAAFAGDRLEAAGANAVHGEAGNFLADQSGDRLQVLAILGSGDGQGAALFAGSSGAADAVYVIFGVAGNIKIEDMAHFDDIKTAGGDIATNQ